MSQCSCRVGRSVLPGTILYLHRIIRIWEHPPLVTPASGFLASWSQESLVLLLQYLNDSPRAELNAFENAAVTWLRMPFFFKPFFPTRCARLWLHSGFIAINLSSSTVFPIGPLTSILAFSLMWWKLGQLYSIIKGLLVKVVSQSFACQPVNAEERLNIPSSNDGKKHFSHTFSDDFSYLFIFYFFSFKKKKNQKNTTTSWAR